MGLHRSLIYPSINKFVSSVRIERTTYGLEVRRSVLLSYEDVIYNSYQKYS